MLSLSPHNLPPSSLVSAVVRTAAWEPCLVLSTGSSLRGQLLAPKDFHHTLVWPANKLTTQLNLIFWVPPENQFLQAIPMQTKRFCLTKPVYWPKLSPLLWPLTLSEYSNLLQIASSNDFGALWKTCFHSELITNDNIIRASIEILQTICTLDL